MASQQIRYPFSAVVGQDELRLALILTAISPRIGGVVIRGEKGTAKTTTVRAFAGLLGDAPLVNLPLGSTEDRVVGSLNMETVLTTGRAEYQPGLLAQADGGVLYVDEVNLLADHLVDALLDAAASGRVSIERDGISHSSPANFVLVGTMNPEEGELRPQLLDRFGLAVDVAASTNPEVRVEIIRRRLDFENAPEQFMAKWAEQDADTSNRILAAKDLLPGVELPDLILSQIAWLCARIEVDGMRADLVITRTALAHAAWSGRSVVTEEDVEIAARLALPHRRRRNPFDAPEMEERKLQETLQEARDFFKDNEDKGPAAKITDEETGAEAFTDTDNPTEEDGLQGTAQAKAQTTGKVGTAGSGDPFRS
ncbi:ATP-binding protein [Corynebacterium glutamicum]|uniref:ATP-binding protein n=1 Tax=Corynebacterium glutamicum TaxID=1718 RepID=UPI00146523F0|nr:ATP-binding protein [Corynebacterium glutamicum]GFK19144.1 magnesium chelatase [Corynebacterium glutamicum]